MEIHPLIDPFALHYDTFAGDVYTLDTAGITLTGGGLIANTVNGLTLSGTGSMDIAAGKTVNIDNNLTVNSFDWIFTNSGIVYSAISSSTNILSFLGTVSINQSLLTVDDVTFNTVNTGQGAYELYAMDQDVLTTSDVVFAGLVVTDNAGGTDRPLEWVYTDASNNYLEIGDAVRIGLEAGVTTLTAIDTATDYLNLRSAGASGVWVNYNGGGTAGFRVYDGGNEHYIWLRPGQILDETGQILFPTNQKLLFRDAALGIYSQADTFLDLFADGAVRIGDSSAGAPTNYSKFEADGTLEFNGAATVFNDLVLPLDSAKVPAANAPSWESFVGNLNAFAYQVNDFQEFTTELIHGYKTGSTFEFHIHGALNALTAAEETVKFEIEYSIADADVSDGFGDVFPNPTIINAELTVPNATADLTNVFITIGTDATGNFGMDATIKGRVRRIGSSGTELVGDIFVTQVGVHYEIDTVGSRQIGTK